MTLSHPSRGMSMTRPRLLPVALAAVLACVTFVPAASGRTASPQATSSTALSGIRATMIGGNTIGDQVRERRPRSDGYFHVDTPRLIRRLEQLHANTYVYQVWDSPTDWSDLVNEFAPAAQAAGIRIIPYLVPPSECSNPTDPVLANRGKCSAPYNEDYVAWAAAIASLSLRYPNVVGWAIDDFTQGSNARTFTPEYMQQIKDTEGSINPKLGLWSTLYYGETVSDAILTKYAPYIAGIVYAYHDQGTNTQDASWVQPHLDEALKHTAPLGLQVLFLEYTGRHIGSPITPTARYVTDVIEALRPYVADGRIAGIVSYGTPTERLPEVGTNDRARTGTGRLSLSLSDRSATKAGDFAQATQDVRVAPGRSRYDITFSEADQWPDTPGLITGYHLKQLLVDGTVVWESDVVDGAQERYATHTIDVTDQVRGKSSVAVTFRLFAGKAVGDYPVDVSIDDVDGDGLAVRNGGFEDDSAWVLDHGGAAVLPLIDHWSANRPLEAAAAVGREFGLMGGAEVAPLRLHPTPPPPNRRAMFGRGRLSLAVESHRTVAPGQCATASQQVSVRPGLPRYQLSFWSFDQWRATPVAKGIYAKEVLVDGEPIFDVDVTSDAEYTWVEGQSLKGPVDISQLVAGKRSVTLTLGVCTRKASTDVPVDVGFDHLRSLGLRIHNPDFDRPGDWTLGSAGALRAGLDIATRGRG